MYRKALVQLLLDNPMSLSAIAEAMEVTPREVEEDLQHLQRSLRHSEYRLLVHPAVCRKCGFRFKEEKLHKPGKCPQCHHSWIEEPRLEIRRL